MTNKRTFFRLFIAICIMMPLALIFSACGHIHVFSKEWTRTAKEHYHKCLKEGCTEVSDKGNHSAGAWIIDLEPTCTTAGSKHKECVVCGYLMETETISATGHNFVDASYVWSSDYTTCTATRTCTKDVKHVQTETVKSVSSIIQEQNCVNDEKTKYVATFSNPAFLEQTEIVTTQNKLDNHVFVDHICKYCGTLEDGYIAKVSNDTSEIAYSYFQDAVDAAMNGDTISLYSDITLTSIVLIDKDLTFDFNGHKITSTQGVFDVANTRKGSEITLINGQIITEKWGVWLQNYAKLTVGKDFVVVGNSAEKYTDKPAVVVTQGSELNLYGKLITPSATTLSGNGNNGDGKITINIYNGAEVISEDDVSIYMPNTDYLNIYGGTITGATALYIKCGIVNISGGTLKSTGTRADFVSRNDGCVATGDCVVVEACNYPGGVPTVNITGGEFITTADGTEKIIIYNVNGKHANINSIISIVNKHFFTTGLTSKEANCSEKGLNPHYECWDNGHRTYFDINSNEVTRESLETPTNNFHDFEDGVCTLCGAIDVSMTVTNINVMPCNIGEDILGYVTFESDISKMIKITDEMIVSGTVDKTSAGTYNVTIQINSFSKNLDIIIYDPNDKTVNNIYVSSKGDVLWVYESNKIIPNLDGLILNVDRNNGTRESIRLTNDMISYITPDLTSGGNVSLNVTVTYENKTTDINVLLIPQSDFETINFAESAQLAIGDYNQGLNECQDICIIDNDLSRYVLFVMINLTREGNKINVVYAKDLSLDMLYSSEDGLSFTRFDVNNATNTFYQLYFGFEGVYSQKNVYIVNAINENGEIESEINFYRFESNNPYIDADCGILNATVGEKQEFLNNINNTQCFFEINYQNSSIYSKYFIMTEDLIINLNEIDFNKPGVYKIKFNVDGCVCEADLYILPAEKPVEYLLLENSTMGVAEQLIYVYENDNICIMSGIPMIFTVADNDMGLISIKDETGYETNLIADDNRKIVSWFQASMLGGDPTLYYYSNSIRELNIDVYTKNNLTYADIYVVNKNSIIYQTTLSVVFEKQNEATIIVIEEERFIVGEKNNNTGRYLLTNFI